MYDFFPENCPEGLPEVNCLRIDLKEAECSGDKISGNLPIVYRGQSMSRVGKALTECEIQVLMAEITVYRIDTVPGCKTGESSLDGHVGCIKFV